MRSCTVRTCVSAAAHPQVRSGAVQHPLSSLLTKGGSVHYICSSSFFPPGQYIMRFQVRNDKELIFLSFICFYLVPVKEHMHTVITTGFFLSRVTKSTMDLGLCLNFSVRVALHARNVLKRPVLCCYPDYDR